MALRPPQNGPPSNSLPPGANFLMTPGDRDPGATAGGQDDDGPQGMVPPELQQALQLMVQKFGTQLVQQALNDSDMSDGEGAADQVGAGGAGGPPGAGGMPDQQ